MKCFVFCFLCESNIGIFQRGIDGEERRIGFWGRNEVEFGKLLIKGMGSNLERIFSMSEFSSRGMVTDG